MDQPFVYFIREYRGYRIIIYDVGGAWQARVEGIGALSDLCSTPLDAFSEAKRYLDEQASEKRPAREFSRT